MRKPCRASRVLFMYSTCTMIVSVGVRAYHISGVAFQGLWYGSMVKGTLIKHACRLVRSSYCILLLVFMSWEQPAIHACTTPTPYHTWHAGNSSRGGKVLHLLNFSPEATYTETCLATEYLVTISHCIILLLQETSLWREEFGRKNLPHINLEPQVTT